MCKTYFIRCLFSCLYLPLILLFTFGLSASSPISGLISNKAVFSSLSQSPNTKIEKLLYLGSEYYKAAKSVKLSERELDDIQKDEKDDLLNNKRELNMSNPFVKLHVFLFGKLSAKLSNKRRDLAEGILFSRIYIKLAVTGNKENIKKVGKGLKLFAGKTVTKFSVYKDTKSEYSEPIMYPELSKPLINSGGIVIGMSKKGSNEYITCITDDLHSLIIGATRSGKTRCLVIQSVASLGLAGESIIINDPKGEIYHYTRRFLESLGYEVIVMDFQNPAKSSTYNPLQNIIDAVNDGKVDLAQTYAWDLTSFLVEKNDHSEPIWSNGEMSIISAAILCVVYDNRNRPEFQNLTNVYHFIANMCKSDGEKDSGDSKPPIVQYVKNMPDDHPAKPLLGISSVAPSRTAGSFYTSALTTLRLFTAKDIYSITKNSDFSLSDTGKKKQAVFYILPDEKTTFYPIVTLLVSQQYEQLVKLAKRNGNRLPYRVNMILDEFGNFTKIADIEAKLTVGAGYGIRFNLFLQDFNQLDNKYGKEVAGIIKGNCQTWVYLLSTDNETLKVIETRLGTYTTSSYSLSSNTQKYHTPSSGHNLNLIQRNLLDQSEISRLVRPYQIVITPNYPAIMHSPDLSKWYYNRMLGLGDRKQNQRIIKQDEDSRVIRNDTSNDILIWKIWDRVNEEKRLISEARKVTMNKTPFKNPFI